jgi:hypothetical protein
MICIDVTPSALGHGCTIPSVVRTGSACFFFKSDGACMSLVRFKKKVRVISLFVQRVKLRQTIMFIYMHSHNGMLILKYRKENQPFTIMN